jgi:hypothetical protein
MTILKEITIGESTIETIDRAIYEHLTNLALQTNSNEGFEPVEVIWVSAERSFLSKKSKDAQDHNGALAFPLITIERTSIAKDLTKKGTIWANIPPAADEKGGSITIARRINQDKTSNFANRDSMRKEGQLNSRRANKKVVYETVSVPIPVYLTVMYKISIRTNYQQQMNELLAPFLAKTGGVNYFLVTHGEHRYECFTQQDFAQNNNLKELASEERMFETSFDIRCLGYLIGLDKNQEQPKIVVRENAVEITFPREHVIFGDKPENTDKFDHYLGTEPLDKK